MREDPMTTAETMTMAFSSDFKKAAIALHPKVNIKI